jgi:predicted nucleotidyltransferase component of viral defense system
MITKAEILKFAKLQTLQPTTVEKDYVLGWTLAAISEDEFLVRWVFKGGTCLKKCFFDTYRFSEDLDFTIPKGEKLTETSIGSGLRRVADRIAAEVGIQAHHDNITVAKYENPRGNESFRAIFYYDGPLGLPRGSRQRIKFDLTQDELIAEKPELRKVFNPYSDVRTKPVLIYCYSIDEILAEKTRALYERQGRARDVYDTVHLSREFRELIKPGNASEILRRKFEFKALPEPTVALILDRVDEAVLRANWEQQLAHQLPVLPAVDGFINDLPDTIAWWLEPGRAAKPLDAIPAPSDKLVSRQRFSTVSLGRGFRIAGVLEGLALDRIRYAARNRLCAEIQYHGVPRVVEPYSLRVPATGNRLLYVYELMRGGSISNRIKSFKVKQIQSAEVTERPFVPRYLVEI